LGARSYKEQEGPEGTRAAVRNGSCRYGRWKVNSCCYACK